MNDNEFDEAIAKSHKHLKRSMECLMGCSNKQGQFPQINFDSLILQHQAIVTALKESRVEKPSLILVPGSPEVARG